MQPCPDVHSDLAQCLDRLESALDPRGRSIEDREDAVPCRVDHSSAMLFHEMTHDLVVLAEEAFPRLVSHPTGELGRAHDIGEEDRDEDVLALGGSHQREAIPRVDGARTIVSRPRGQRGRHRRRPPR